MVLAQVLVYAATLAPGLSWHNNGADGGDLAAAVAVMGVAHPAGYPTYLLLARLVQGLLPFGSLAYRLTLLSAACAAATGAVTTFIIASSYRGSARFGWVGGIGGGFAFGLSPLLWSQAVIVEVYALHILLLAGVILLAVADTASSTPGQLRRARLGGLLLGVALGNHLTTALFVPAWLAVLGWRNRQFRRRHLVETLACLGLGLLVYLYIPFRAVTNPAVNWGGASNWAGFWWLVSGQDYRGLVFGLPSSLLPARLQAWAGLMIAQLTWPGLLLALYGFFFGRIRSAATGFLTFWLMGAYSIFAIGYGTSDSSVYLLPAFLALAVWFGLGLAGILEHLAGRWQGLRPVAVGSAVLVIFVGAVQHLPDLDASRDMAAQDFGRVVLSAAPLNAIVFSSGDRDSFSLAYYLFAERRRPDLVLVVEPLLKFQWYRDNLTHTYTDLNLPAGGPISPADLINRNNRPACRTFVEASPPLQCDEAS